MKDRSVAFLAISIFVAVAFIGGMLLGAMITTKANEQIASLQVPMDSPELDLEAVEARAVSALDEIRTLYQGMTVLASWYGEPYHGRRAADGSIYDMSRETVASRVLPLGTIVVLENTANGRLAMARVTDRGPYVDGRALDVSHAIAVELGMVRDGLATVRMWAVSIPAGEMVLGRTSEGD
jgi:rare lipoprotein A (peptidoglycan hydrolase)